MFLPEKVINWECFFVGSYRLETPSMATYSKGGSIFVIAYGSIITLWDSRLNVIDYSLPLIPNDGTVKHLAFTNDLPFLVTTTERHLSVFNLLTCTIHHLAVDPKNSSSVVACNNERLGEVTFQLQFIM
ncbi:9290_t:CDS:2 [Diversispora eburnea]|uniref:9290_t:CDS:1 n=1 Tax=Diversispora eburnea TaxID=1213867 RepID=A0A9N9BF55_9GLOM|nr:9290_t:CDS:2 [Diversispora eburnea]